MRSITKAAIGSLLALLAIASSAFTVGNTVTFGRITWSVSTGVNGLAGCTQLVLNGSGDFLNTGSLSLFGAYNCPASNSGFPATGVAYIGTDGLFTMSFNFAGSQFSCPRMSPLTLSGACNIFGPTGTAIGSATINLL